MTKLHPISKIFLSFALLFIPFIMENIFDIMFLLLFVIFLIIITKIPLFTRQFRKIIIAFLSVNTSIFIVWCLLSNRTGSITYFETTIIIIENKWEWHILITNTTLLFAGRIALRITIMFFLTFFFFITTSDRDLIHGLRLIKIPFTITLMISMTFRGLSMFQQEYSMVKEALMTRGVEFEKASIVQRIKNFISVFIALVVLMFKKTEDIAASIESRGIPMKSEDRTTYAIFSFKKKDFLILFIILFLLISSIYLRIIGSSYTSLILNLVT